MSIDPWTLALQTVNALLLVWLLGHFLFRPVVAAIAARRASVDAQLDQAAAIAARAASAESDARAALARIAVDREAALARVREEAAALRGDLLEGAHRERDELVASGHEETLRSREAMMVDVGVQANELAIEIARKLVSRLPDEARIAGFVTPLIDAVRGLPEATRERLGTDGDVVRLIAPRHLSESERRTTLAALDAALGHETVVETRVDPRLIAGLELESGFGVIRNSLKAGLAAIGDALGDPRPETPPVLPAKTSTESLVATPADTPADTPAGTSVETQVDSSGRSKSVGS